MESADPLTFLKFTAIAVVTVASLLGAVPPVLRFSSSELGNEKKIPRTRWVRRTHLHAMQPRTGGKATNAKQVSPDKRKRPGLFTFLPDRPLLAHRLNRRQVNDSNPYIFKQVAEAHRILDTIHEREREMEN